jgi:hypothetical protein
MGFKEMKMMKSTEPSVDEVGKGMKKGGKTKKMAMGGGMPMGALQSAAPVMARPAMGARRPMARRPDPRQAMMEAAMAEQAAAQPMMRRKKGGEVESKEMHAKEERQIKGIKKELMTHEDKPASKAHKGLATGGVANAQGGYKKGGVAKYATGGLIQKYATGGVVNGAAGYKEGGHAVMKCKDGGGFKAMKKGNC